jgi:ubiquinone/menaquinone biosynthesis C-methylase UbiE
MKKKFIFFIKKCLGEKLYLRIKGYLIINYNNTYMWSFLVGKPNSLKYQKLWSKFYLKSDDKENFSSAWGKIDQYNEGQGDYRIVLKKIILMSKSFDSILEIGCLDGKWSEVLVEHFDEVHLMDLNDKLLPILDKKFGNNFRFHTTNGNELKSLDDDSIELIFSMDSFVRVPNKKYILDYLNEFKRVLKKQGEVYVHLPCNSKKECIKKRFTDISKPEILNFSEMVGLKLIEFDEQTLDHGILLHLIKE